MILGEQIKLTAFEYTILETLMRNQNKVVKTEDVLMRQLYPDAEQRESHTIDVLMGRLRKKNSKNMITMIIGKSVRQVSF